MCIRDRRRLQLCSWPPSLYPLNVFVNLVLEPDNCNFSTTIDGIHRRVVGEHSQPGFRQREFVKKSRIADTIESFLDTKGNGNSLFPQATGLGNGLHETHLLMRRGVTSAKSELLRVRMWNRFK